MDNSGLRYIAVILAIFSINCFADTEISVFAGQRWGGEFKDSESDMTLEIDESSTAGFVIDYDLNDNQQIEFLYSHQNSVLLTGELFSGTEVFAIDIDYYHIGGVYLYDGEHWRPFITGTLGITRFDPVNQYDDETRFSMSLGGGVRRKLTDSILLRFDARAYSTLLDSGSAIFCSGDGCSIAVSGTTYWQYEISAGLGFSF
jgi:hypothetical protein